MEILAYTITLFGLGGLFSILLLYTNPYYKNKINSADTGGSKLIGLHFESTNDAFGFI